jgi:hypothetical protein
MAARKFNLSRTVLAAAFLSLTPQAVMSAEFPQATQKLLKELGKAPSLLAGLDRELAVPKAWVDSARKEGAMTLGGRSAIPSSKSPITGRAATTGS